jgi:hypothetical protein
MRKVVKQKTVRKTILMETDQAEASSLLQPEQVIPISQCKHCWHRSLLNPLEARERKWEMTWEAELKKSSYPKAKW